MVRALGIHKRVGTESQPTLRAERESLSLLHILRADDKPQSEWLNAITSDQTLSAPVRQRALQFARDWKP